MYHESIYLEKDAVQTDKFHLLTVPNQLKQKLSKKLTSTSTILWGTENKLKYKKCYYIVQILHLHPLLCKMVFLFRNCRHSAWTWLWLYSLIEVSKTWKCNSLTMQLFILFQYGSSLLSSFSYNHNFTVDITELLYWFCRKSTLLLPLEY